MEIAMRNMTRFYDRFFGHRFSIPVEMGAPTSPELPKGAVLIGGACAVAGSFSRNSWTLTAQAIVERNGKIQTHASSDIDYIPPRWTATFSNEEMVTAVNEMIGKSQGIEGNAREALKARLKNLLVEHNRLNLMRT
jgi:hypothetical protein